MKATFGVIVEVVHRMCLFDACCFQAAVTLLCEVLGPGCRRTGQRPPLRTGDRAQAKTSSAFGWTWMLVFSEFCASNSEFLSLAVWARTGFNPDDCVPFLTTSGWLMEPWT